jgi:hypothetical protein
MKKIFLGTMILSGGFCLGALLARSSSEVVLILGFVSALAATLWLLWPRTRTSQEDGAKSRIGGWWETVKAVFWGL